MPTTVLLIMLELAQQKTIVSEGKNTVLERFKHFLSSSVDSSLRAEIDASEKYQCRVVYQKLVDGQSQEAYLNSNFPEDGCIAGACSKKIVDIPVEAPNTRGTKSCIFFKL